MTLERAIALIFIVVCVAYGYTAFVVMEAAMLPFERNMTFLPNELPKWLSVIGALVGVAVLVQSGSGTDGEAPEDDIDVGNLRQYKLGQAIFLLVLMVAYALLLRPIGFVTMTTLFLVVGAMILGERRYIVLVPVALLAAFLIWYLVQEVLGIFLRPWPWFLFM
ncbi:MAG: tripartite tricarboxylate transporter TctB family protein [Deltaproteobacteria bacterium]|nr:tripartite tricarboxylate transporter TctB family protein [Deltaproteobacteria bacterium]